MKIDFSTIIKGLDGKDLTEGEKKVSLALVSSNALMAPFPDEQNLDPVEKVKRFKLATKVVDGGEVELTVEDVAELKKLIGKAYGPLIVGRAYAVLDPETPTTH